MKRLQISRCRDDLACHNLVEGVRRLAQPLEVASGLEHSTFQIETADRRRLEEVGHA